MQEPTHLQSARERVEAIARYLTDESKSAERENKRRFTLRACCQHTAELLKAVRDLEGIAANDTADENEIRIEIVTADLLRCVTKIESVLKNDRAQRRRNLTTNVSPN